MKAINNKNRFNPIVPKAILLILAGTMWVCVGIMLISMALHWLHAHKDNFLFFILLGVIAGLIIHHFGFLKIVNKNMERIAELPTKSCIFSFISWKSYLIIALMITLGISLRHSSIHKHYLSVIYIGIGSALLLSGLRYFRNFVSIIIKDRNTENKV